MRICSGLTLPHASPVSGKVTWAHECLIPEEPSVQAVCLGNLKMRKPWGQERYNKEMGGKTKRICLNSHCRDLEHKLPSDYEWSWWKNRSFVRITFSFWDFKIYTESPLWCSIYFNCNNYSLFYLHSFIFSVLFVCVHSPDSECWLSIILPLTVRCSALSKVMYIEVC